MPAIVRTRGNSVAREQRRRAAVVLAREAATQVGPPGPLWVKLAVLALRPSLPVYPQHQTFPAPAGTSQKCQDRTFPGWLGQWDRATRIIEGVLRVREF